MGTNDNTSVPMESKLLIQEPPLQVLPSLVKMIGLNEAVVLQQIHYWLIQKKNFRDGRYWIYNSYPEWEKQFPFWGERTIQRIFRSLENQELLDVGNYNEHNFDRTKWYTIRYDTLQKLQSSEENTPLNPPTSTDIESPQRQADVVVTTSWRQEDGKLASSSIPETTSENTTEIREEKSAPPNSNMESQPDVIGSKERKGSPDNSPEEESPRPEKKNPREKKVATLEVESLPPEGPRSTHVGEENPEGAVPKDSPSPPMTKDQLIIGMAGLYASRHKGAGNCGLKGHRKGEEETVDSHVDELLRDGHAPADILGAYDFYLGLGAHTGDEWLVGKDKKGKKRAHPLYFFVTKIDEWLSRWSVEYEPSPNTEKSSKDLKTKDFNAIKFEPSKIDSTEVDEIPF